jgi:Ca2+-binding RTX toxin-like protein
LQITGSSTNDVMQVTRETGGTAVPAKATFAAILNTDGGVQQLLVNGNSNGKIALPKHEEFIHIHTKHAEFYFPSDEVTGVSINGGAGDDDIVVSTNVRLPCTLLGGDGNDTLEGSTRADSIDGNDGNDLIIGGKRGTAGNTLIGGNGADTIAGTSVNDSVISPPDGFRDQITILTDNLQLTLQTQHFTSEDLVTFVQVSSGGVGAHPTS